MNTVYHFLLWKKAAICVCLLITGLTVSAQFYYNEPCTGATGQFILHGNAVYTAGPGSNIDPVGDGWIRLTTNQTDQKGWVVFDHTFPSTMGATIEFDFKVWTPTNPQWGLADGFTVFLFDAASGLDIQPGQPGGAIGYGPNCQGCSNPGLSNGYLGVGIDEFGNFSSTWNGSCCNWTATPSTGGINPGSNQIAIRGPAATGYQWIAGSGENLGTLNTPIAYTPLTNNRPSDNIYYRRVRVDILPNSTGGMEVYAYVRLQPTASWEPIIGPVQVTYPAPELFGMGFIGVTGGGWAIHEVRNLIARTPGDLYVYMPEMPCVSVDPMENTTIPIHIVNGFGPADSLKVCDTLPAGFNLIEPPVATTNNPDCVTTLYNFTQTVLPDGRLLCCYWLDMSINGEVVMTYTGHFEGGIGGSFTVGSTITPPPSNFADIDPNDNSFITTIPLIQYDTLTICHGSIYQLGSQTLTASGSYVEVFQDVNGCDSIIHLALTVHEDVNFDLGADVVLCSGDPAWLSTDYSRPLTSYYWNTGATTSEIMVISEGIYTLTVSTWIEDSTILCHKTDTVRVISTPYPVADFIADVTEGCTPLSVQMHNLTDFDNHVHPYTDVEVSYSWEVYDEDGQLQFVSQEPEPKIEFTQQGNFHILLIATTSTGCIDSLMKLDYIHSVLQPHVEFMAIPETAFLSDSGIYFLNFADTTILADENTTWYWDFGDGTTDSSSYSPTHHYEEWGDYEVVFYVSNGLGCNDQIAHLVSIEADLLFPNVITPNGDGLNDVFAIENLNTRINPNDPSQFRTNLLAIFNRWGKKVYEAENYDTYVKDGDITVGHKAFGGENCPDGTYYYTFYYKGKLRSINVNGTLMILREAQKSK